MPRVMVVDDDRDFRSALSDLLSLCGYSVVEAATAREALQTLRTGGAGGLDALLVDLVLPEMDGVAFLEALRLPPAIDVPAIVMTGFADAPETRRLGVPVLSKGGLEGLLAMVEAQVARARAVPPV